MKPWTVSATMPLSKLEGALPVASEKGSRGGHDVEAILSRLATTAKGPILVFSPNASQLPVGGKGVLVGGDGSVSGFDRPQREVFQVQTLDGPRRIHVTLLAKNGQFGGDIKRVPIKVPEPKTDLPSDPSSKTSPFPWNLVFAFIVGLITFVVGLFIGRRSGLAPATLPPGGDSGELEAWKQESKAQHRRLDLIAQEIAESSSQITGFREDDLIALRQEIARNERALKTWDETAMDYLDGIDRALENPELSTEQRQIWERALTQFTKLAQRVGLDLISPAIGDQVLDGQHKIEMVVPSSNNLANGTISELISPGYRRGDQVLRQAKIILVGDNL